MGEFAQRRIVRKLDLEIFLSQIKPVLSPRADLEQYLITETVAATILLTAAYCFNDIIDRSVLDLGCGTGRLSLGASYLGASSVLGIDVDKEVVKTAFENSCRVGLYKKTQWIVGSIRTITGRFDTVVQNPPFGVQKRYADREFLEKALQVGRAIYSLHNHPEPDSQLMEKLKNTPSRMLQVSPSPFLKKFIERRGGFIRAVYAMPMSIPRTFDFHTKAKHEIIVDLYLIKTRNTKRK